MAEQELKPVSAKEFSSRQGISATEVITQLKNGQISGFRKQSIWYVDDQNLLDQLEPLPAAEDTSPIGTPHNHQNPETNPAARSMSSRTPTGHHTISEADPIASALNIFGWVILVLALLFGMAVTSNVDGYIGVGVIVAGLFQALLLMGFARIINYLKTLVGEGRG